MTKNQAGLRQLLERYGIIIVVAVMMIVLHFLQPDVFLSLRNLTNIFKQIATNALLALGMFLVILTAGIDLSVGSVMALSMVTLAVASAAGCPWFVALFISPLVGMICGLINGLGLTLLRLPHPFIMTLGILVTPVFYPPPTSWPLSFLINFVNPVSGYVIAARDLAATGALSHPWSYLYSVVLSILCFFAGWRLFHLLEPKVAERV